MLMILVLMIGCRSEPIDYQLADDQRAEEHRLNMSAVSMIGSGVGNPYCEPVRDYLYQRCFLWAPDGLYSFNCNEGRCYIKSRPKGDL